MRKIEEMREKHWSGVKTLWPAKTSKVEVPFCWEEFKINRDRLKDAQSYAKSGFWPSASYHLTAAYKGGPENEAFWNQFI